MPVHPEYVAFLKMVAAAAPPAGAEIPVADSRANYRAMRPATPELAVAAVRDRTIPGPAGAIPIRIYTPSGRGPFPILVNFHGGGWVIGDLDTADAVSREFCNRVGCVVVSVDYRLAPEHPYPAAVDDAYAATCWVADNAAEHRWRRETNRRWRRERGRQSRGGRQSHRARSRRSGNHVSAARVSGDRRRTSRRNRAASTPMVIC